MIDRAATHGPGCIVLVLTCLLAAGCAGSRHVPTTGPVPATPPAASIPVAGAPAEIPQEAEVAPAAGEAPEARAAPAPSPPAIEPVRPAPPAPAPRAVVPRAPATVAPAKAVAAPTLPPKPAAAASAAAAPAPPAAPKGATAPPVAPPSAAPLDLKSLEVRLRQTKAIGVLTKLSLKNQVDDLLEQFRAYHKRQGTATLADLRRNYDMLLLKVLSLLQDSDPPLARDIVKSRAAIWSILEDPRKFTESKLMAGATP